MENDAFFFPRFLGIKVKLFVLVMCGASFRNLLSVRLSFSFSFFWWILMIFNYIVDFFYFVVGERVGYIHEKVREYYA